MAIKSLRFIIRFLSFHFSVQETDGSYFESFTALSWKRDNRRFSAIRVSETRAETLPENEREQPVEDEMDRPENKEQLYVDVLYTISNTVGAPAPGGQVNINKPNKTKKFYFFDSKRFRI